MSNELIINYSQDGLEIALLENQNLIEYHKEKVNAAFQVGDFYLGKVKKIVPSLNAAFVQIGAEKDAFLTYFDLGPNILSLKKFTRMATTKGGHKGIFLDKFELEPKTEKTGKINQVLKPNQNILVQIIKEPIGTKGSKITTDISIPGRHFVLMPFSNQVSISKKIGTPEEKKRLLNYVKTIKPKNFGIIVRTVAEDVPIEELDASLREQLKKWDQLVKNMAKAPQKSLVLGEGNRIETVLRDLYNTSFSSIVVNDHGMAESVKNYIAAINPEATKIVKHYEGKQHIFDTYGINKKIKSSFGKSVPVTAGAYLVIEHTEALHVIDVNSGNSSFDPKSREENVYKVNIQAVKEVARQVRLRDMGGIIVVDFIDMKDADKRKEIVKLMRDAMRSDKARHTILPISKFGLMQITRERVRPETQIITTEECISCGGSGKMENSQQIEITLHNQIDYFWENMNVKKLKLKAHPFIISYIKEGIPSRRMKWLMEYKRWLQLESDANLPLHHFQFFSDGEPIL